MSLIRIATTQHKCNITQPHPQQYSYQQVAVAQDHDSAERETARERGERKDVCCELAGL